MRIHPPNSETRFRVEQSVTAGRVEKFHSWSQDIIYSRRRHVTESDEPFFKFSVINLSQKNTGAE
jgi:hypothetical protein